MNPEIWRYSSDDQSTLGSLMLPNGTGWEMLCFTLEDRYRPPGAKVPGSTRIPAGRYRLTLRTEGGMHARYALHYPGMHRGMLWLRDVPDFEWVYLHVGNHEDDTAGCPLLGEYRNEQARTVGASRTAYRRVYPILATGEDVWLTIRDLDRRPTPAEA